MTESDPALYVWLTRMHIECMRATGQVEQARLALAPLIVTAEQIAPARLGSLYHMAGIIEENHGTTEASMAYYETALQHHTINDDVFRIGLTHGQRATAVLIGGELTKSVEMFQQSLTVLASINARHSLAIYTGNLAVAYLKLEQFELAETALLDAMRLSREVGSRRFEIGNRSNLALLYATRGDHAKASGLYQQVLATFAAEGEEMEEAITLSNLADAQMRMGELGRALANYERAGIALDARELTYNRIGHRLGACATYRLAGQPNQAAKMLDEASDLLAIKDSSEYRPWALAERGLLATDRALALEYLSAAKLVLASHPQPAASHAMWAVATLEQLMGQS